MSKTEIINQKQYIENLKRLIESVPLSKRNKRLLQFYFSPVMGIMGPSETAKKFKVSRMRTYQITQDFIEKVGGLDKIFGVQR